MTAAATAPPLGSEADAPETTPTVSVLHRDYFEQIIPELPIVCGRRLKPLSIGRYRLMSRYKVAFVSDTETTAAAGDLLMGVLICSLTCAEFTEAVASENFYRDVEAWGRKAGFLPPACLSWPIIGRWLTKAGGDYIARSDARVLLEQVQLFKTYIANGSKSPQYWDETSDSRVSAGHWSQSIEATLREYQGWTRAEIDEEPLNKALWDYFKTMENHGLVRLMTTEESEELATELTPEQIAESEAAMRAIMAFKGITMEETA